MRVAAVRAELIPISGFSPTPNPRLARAAGIKPGGPRAVAIAEPEPEPDGAPCRYNQTDLAD